VFYPEETPMNDFLNVMNHGAKGNNIDDDWPALQELINGVSAKLGKSAIYFPEGNYRITKPLELKPNVWLVGQSPKMSVIEAHVSDALVFSPTFLNARVDNLRLQGAGACAGHIGVRLSGSQMNRLDTVEIWNFDTGIELSDGAAVFSGYNTISRFQVTGCKTGVRAYQHANSNTLHDGRVLGKNGGDIGIDVKDVAALAIHGVTSEGSDVPLLVRGAVRCSVTSCYLEAFGGKPAFDIELSNDEPERSALVFTGNHCSAPGRLVVPPEALFEGDSPALPGHAPARHPASTAGRNYVRNGDLRMWQPPPAFNIPNWDPTGTVSEEAVDFVTSGRSMRIEGASHAACGFEVPDACAWVTAGVRYKIVTTPPPTFQLVNGESSLLVDAPPGPAGVWREDFFSIRSTPGAEGAFRIFANGGEVLVDEVWTVAGRVAVASRAYAERVEMLQHPRPLVVREKAAANEVWTAPPLVGLLQKPVGAVGAVLRLSVLCKLPVTAPHHLSFGTTGGPDAPPPPRCCAVFQNVQATQDVTVRIGATLSGEYHTGDATPVKYEVWLLGWVVV
jgi:hypothetical protein